MAFFFRHLPGCREALRLPQRGPALVRHFSLFDWKFWNWGREERLNEPGQVGANVKHTGENGSLKASADVTRPVSAADGQLSLESGMRQFIAVHPGARGLVLSEVVVTSTEHEKQCAMCMKVRSRRDFRKLRSSPDGVHYLCRGCLSQVHRARRQLAEAAAEGQEYCPCCGEMKDETLFGKGPRDRRGLQRLCRACMAECSRKRPHVEGRSNKKWPVLPAHGPSMSEIWWADGLWVPVEKVCHACGKLKAAGDYFSRAANIDGLTQFCKVCFRERYF